MLESGLTYALLAGEWSEITSEAFWAKRLIFKHS